MPSLRVLRNHAFVAASLVALLPSCRDKTPARVDAAAPSPSVSVVTFPSAPKASASAPPIVVLSTFDAGAPSSCRLVQGPVQQALTGPAALAVSSRGLEVVHHRSGISVVNVVPITAPPPANAKVQPTRQPLPVGAGEKASKPPCAVAGRFAYCSDTKGVIHKSMREMASDEILTQALPGARLTAASFDDHHIVVGTIQAARMPEGERFEVWAKLDAEPPVRISEEGAGASEVLFVTRKPGEIAAWMIDARVAMTPIHYRVLRLVDKKLVVGPDVVVHVAGGSSRILPGALATTDQGALFGLVAGGAETGFGLHVMPITADIKEGAPFEFSAYPNGLDGAPLAATTGGKSAVVARVRPSLGPGQVAGFAADGGAPIPAWVLELGRLGAKGEFESLGLVPSSGSVTGVSVALDSFGALWLYYTDGSGSWLERRVCP